MLSNLISRRSHKEEPMTAPTCQVSSLGKTSARARIVLATKQGQNEPNNGPSSTHTTMRDLSPNRKGNQLGQRRARLSWPAWMQQVHWRHDKPELALFCSSPIGRVRTMVSSGSSGCNYCIACRANLAERN